MTTPASLQSVN